MAKQDPAPVLYPCMIQKPDMRRVHEPADERIVARTSRVRRVFARLAVAPRP
jgi:hypothetical protein